METKIEPLAFHMRGEGIFEIDLLSLGTKYTNALNYFEKSIGSDPGTGKYLLSSVDSENINEDVKTIFSPYFLAGPDIGSWLDHLQEAGVIFGQIRQAFKTKSKSSNRFKHSIWRIPAYDPEKMKCLNRITRDFMRSFEVYDLSHESTVGVGLHDFDIGDIDESKEIDRIIANFPRPEYGVHVSAPYEQEYEQTYDYSISDISEAEMDRLLSIHKLPDYNEPERHQQRYYHKSDVMLGYVTAIISGETIEDILTLAQRSGLLDFFRLNPVRVGKMAEFIGLSKEYKFYFFEYILCSMYSMNKSHYWAKFVEYFIKFHNDQSIFIEGLQLILKGEGLDAHTLEISKLPVIQKNIYAPESVKFCGIEFDFKNRLIIIGNTVLFNGAKWNYEVLSAEQVEGTMRGSKGLITKEDIKKKKAEILVRGTKFLYTLLTLPENYIIHNNESENIKIIWQIEGADFSNQADELSERFLWQETSPQHIEPGITSAKNLLLFFLPDALVLYGKGNIKKMKTDYNTAKFLLCSKNFFDNHSKSTRL